MSNNILNKPQYKLNFNTTKKKKKQKKLFINTNTTVYCLNIHLILKQTFPTV